MNNYLCEGTGIFLTSVPSESFSLLTGGKAGFKSVVSIASPKNTNPKRHYYSAFKLLFIKGQAFLGRVLLPWLSFLLAPFFLVSVSVSDMFDLLARLHKKGKIKN